MERQPTPRDGACAAGGTDGREGRARRRSLRGDGRRVARRRGERRGRARYRVGDARGGASSRGRRRRRRRRRRTRDEAPSARRAKSRRTDDGVASCAGFSFSGTAPPSARVVVFDGVSATGDGAGAFSAFAALRGDRLRDGPAIARARVSKRRNACNPRRGRRARERASPSTRRRARARCVRAASRVQNDRAAACGVRACGHERSRRAMQCRSRGCRRSRNDKRQLRRTKFVPLWDEPSDFSSH